MEIEREQHGAVTVLAPRGALTEDAAALFAGRLTDEVAASSGRVAVDCSAAPYADSAGLEALVDGADQLERIGQSLRLIAVSPTLRESFDLTGIAGMFEFYADVNAAVRSFL